MFNEISINDLFDITKKIINKKSKTFFFNLICKKIELRDDIHKKNFINLLDECNSSFNENCLNILDYIIVCECVSDFTLKKKCLEKLINKIKCENININNNFLQNRIDNLCVIVSEHDFVLEYIVNARKRVIQTDNNNTQIKRRKIDINDPCSSAAATEFNNNPETQENNINSVQLETVIDNDITYDDVDDYSERNDSEYGFENDYERSSEHYNCVENDDSFNNNDNDNDFDDTNSSSNNSAFESEIIVNSEDQIDDDNNLSENNDNFNDSLNNNDFEEQNAIENYDQSVTNQNDYNEHVNNDSNNSNNNQIDNNSNSEDETDNNQTGTGLSSNNIEIQYNNDDVEIVHQAFRNRVATYIIRNKNNSEMCIKTFMKLIKNLLINLIKSSLEEHISVKINFLLSSLYFKPLCDFQINENVKSINTRNMVYTLSSNISKNIDDTIDVLHSMSEDFQEKGSGWCMKNILYLQVNINKFNPLKASSYIDLPLKIKLQNSCINVKNNDQQCFKWALLSGLHINCNIRNRRSVDSYMNDCECMRQFDFENISYPMELKKIQQFEKKNNISINVFGYKNNQIIGPLHHTNNRKSSHFNLLCFEDDSSPSNYHYCYIKNISALVSKQISNHNGQKFLCDGCLCYFYDRQQLISHQKEDCTHVITKMPSKNDTVHFKQWGHTLKVSFFFIS